MAENNKVDIFGVVRAVFEQEAKAIPQELIDNSFDKLMTKLNERKEADKPSLDSVIEKCASIAANQDCRSEPRQTKTKSHDEL